MQNIISEQNKCFTVFCRDLMVYSCVLLIGVLHNGVLNRFSRQNKASALQSRAMTLKFYMDKWRHCSYYVLVHSHTHQARFSNFLTAAVGRDRGQQMLFYCISNDLFLSNYEAQMCCASFVYSKFPQWMYPSPLKLCIFLDKYPIIFAQLSVQCMTLS